MSLPIARTEVVYKGGRLFHNHIIDIHAKYTGAKDGNTKIDWESVYNTLIPDLVATLNAHGHQLTPSSIGAYPYPPSAFCQENAELYYGFELKNQYGPLSSKFESVLASSGVDRLAIVNSLLVIFETEDIGDVLTNLALASRIAGQPGCDLYFLATYMMLEEHVANMAELTGNSYEFLRSLLSSLFPGISIHQVIRHKLYGFGLCYGLSGLEPKLKVYFRVSDLTPQELELVEAVAQDSFQRVASETGIPKDHGFMIGLDFSHDQLRQPAKFYFREE